MTDKPTRRELMRPAQLLGIAFAAALFGGLITAMSMGAFQALPGDAIVRAWTVAAIVAGVSFIAVLLGLSMLLLLVPPAEQSETMDRPVLLPREDEPGDSPR
ncbi:amino acid transporter [Microbacterium marinilacus]|uniref:Amino acid transporter n=1 Tax=Microbacterium marinilacus TaxID=415209 RepID=A0ABP7BRK8_9MICO|nr:amino acid transporter [Microbacterium marinilacus]MBY0689152.1 amino acid transporter [Microbacterium marinilacus]